MTLMLAALWIAGSTFKWYWLAGAFVFDALWLAIKLNFLTVLVRKSVEQAMNDLAQQSIETARENLPPGNEPSLTP